ncbi:sugar transporter [Rubellimicrobium sp. CFH 75288]|nr:sugar transporter [Rubellimicrobium sp. CFH 75288]
MRVLPAAGPARVRPRHWGLLLAFVLMVIVPVATSVWYLETRAAPQYASRLGFSVRSEEIASASDFLGGLGSGLGLGSSGGRDSDILYEFVRSQEIVELVDRRLDLRSLWSRHVEEDPVFGLDPDGTIEDLTAYWRRMVRVAYDASSGLMEITVLAFAPEDARAVAEAIREESTLRINELVQTARADAMIYASEDLDRAIERLKEAREALTAFRIENQLVDITADIQGQMGLLNTLQAQLASALIDLDMLRQTAPATDPRVTQAEARIQVIEARIEEERRKFGPGAAGAGGRSLAATVAEFERLSVDREYAEATYTAALSAYDLARAEANRRSRYLAAYVRPTLAERAEYPQRLLLIGLVTLFSFLAWAIGSLAIYALRDRR